jgi:hypothetical protein
MNLAERDPGRDRDPVAHVIRDLSEQVRRCELRVDTIQDGLRGPNAKLPGDAAPAPPGILNELAALRERISSLADRLGVVNEDLGSAGTEEQPLRAVR